MDYVIEYFFGILCHRIPLRSYIYNGDIYLCARCTGFYSGFFIVSCLYYCFYIRGKISTLSFNILVYSGIILTLPIIIEKIILYRFAYKIINREILLLNGLFLGEYFALIALNHWLTIIDNNRVLLGTIYDRTLIFLWITLLSIIFFIIIPKIWLLALIIPLLGIVLSFYIINANILIGLKWKSKTINKLLTELIIILMIIIELIIINVIKR